MDGVLPIDFRAWCDNIDKVVHMVPGNGVKLTHSRLDTGEDYISLHQKAEIMLVETRSMILTYYTENLGKDDDFLWISSSEGNEHLLEQFKEHVGKNLIAKLIVNYIRVESKYDSEGSIVGTELTQVVECSPGGFVPDLLKLKAIED